MKNSTLLMVGIVAVISMQSAGLTVLPTTVQQASAQDTNFDFNKIERIDVVALRNVLMKAD
jgi:hypothetical protein